MTQPAGPDLYEAYLTSLDGDESRRTMRSCLGRVAGLMFPRPPDWDGGPWAEHVPWHEIRYQQAIDFRAALTRHAKAKGWSNAHVNKHLAALRGIVRQSWLLGCIDADMRDRINVDALSTVKGGGRKPGRHIRGDEVDRLDSRTAEGGRLIDKRDAAIIAVFHATGGRCSEVAAVRIEHYDRRTGGIPITGKGNKNRVVYLHDDAANRVAEWLAALGVHRGPMFRPVDQWGHVGERALTPRSLGRILERRRVAASVDKVATHDFRRTMISDLLDGGVDLATVQLAAGHASPVTTAGYDRRDERRVRAALRNRSLNATPPPVTEHTD